MIRPTDSTLQCGPFRVSGAVIGHQGLDVVGRVQPEVVPLDVMMPARDGRQVARHKKVDEMLRKVSIIAVWVVHTTSNASRQLQVDDHLRKSLSDELLRRVDGVAQTAAKRDMNGSMSRLHPADLHGCVNR